MKTFLVRSILTIFLVTLLAGCNTPKVENVTIEPPEILYGKLFYAVQSDKNIFPDSKTFVDCIPREDPSLIRKKFSELQDTSSEAIKAFVSENFIIPNNEDSYVTDSSSINEHIKKLWDVLKREPDVQRSGTLIPLPYPYIVPGGRFREIYYWDSYFTMLGLEQDKQTGMIRDMINNFSYLIDKYGYIPNGNRTYYLGRSQPPFYPVMVSILAEATSDTAYKHYLSYMEKEYTFWMDGSEQLSGPGDTFRRVVELGDGEILNRYWSDSDIPRSESYREDVNTAREAMVHNPGKSLNEVYRNLRATAESGWDFTSRWLSADSSGAWKLYTVHTTDIIPVDLNALLYNMEHTLSKTYQMEGDSVKASFYAKRSEQRKNAMMKYCWDNKNGFFVDYNFKKGTETGILSLAGMYPLFFKIASDVQAKKAAENIRRSFLAPGGVTPTLEKTGEQWDSPNGWAPLEWITIRGLKNYNIDDLASTIEKRWLRLNKKVYQATYKMLEKYDVVDTTKKSGGGEYPTQDGFGWTNGVYQKLSEN
ncbi:MAG TPA: alpha,alpha-trehalase TreA [Bacteroidales bacterium]|nr:alpha,alpha-trehalase TreA [Bacteroidales bacterium]